MTDIVNILYKLRVFTLKELADTIDGKLKSVESLIERYKKKGWIRSIRRNTFCVVDMASGLPVCDKFEIGSHLSDTACIAYHSAMEFHGMAHQPFYETFVKSKSRFNSFSSGDFMFTYCRQTKETGGVITPKWNPYVRVTDLECTLIDCFDRIDRAGGIEELMHCLEAVAMVNEYKLIEYLSRHNKAFLYQKTGFLLESIKDQASISDSCIELCHEKGGKNVKWLTNNDESDAYVKEWNLYVPHQLISKEEYELI